MKMLLWLPLCAAGLIGCGAEEPARTVLIREPVTIRVRIPPALLDCPRPSPPPVVDLQSELVAEVLDPAWEGWNACHRALDAVRKWEADEAARR